ncbi:putative protein translocase complex, SecE/Sec61-gamma subunit [Dioscorea sansibarensis]
MAWPHYCFLFKRGIHFVFVFFSWSSSSIARVSRSLSLGLMDALDSVVDPLREFAKDSVRLVKRCHKPDRKEFTKVAVRTAIGFVVMGFVGFFVKLIFIPINNIIWPFRWSSMLVMNGAGLAKISSFG